MRVRWLAKATILTLALGALPLAAGAFFYRSPSGLPLQLQPNQIVQGDYINVGETITLEGNVDGDVIVVAQRLTVAGAVAGDVIAAASDVTITGEVEGDVRVAAMNFTLNGLVEKNLNVWAQHAFLHASSTVSRNAYLAVKSAQVYGTVDGHLAARAHTLTVAGTVRKDARFELLGGGSLQLQPTAQLDGNLTYVAAQAAQLQRDPAATVGGKLTHELPLQPAGGELLRWFLFARIISLFGLMVVGLVLVSLAPRYVLEAVDRFSVQQPWLTVAIGMIGLVATPVLVVALLFTIIGIPLALILGACYLVGLYLGQVISAIAIGVLIFRSASSGKYRGSLLAPMVVGAVVVAVVTSFGPVGWVLKLLAMLWGFGALLRLKGEQLKAWR